MYHRVLSTQELANSYSHPAIVVSPETFRLHIEVLKRWFNVLTPQEFLDHLKNAKDFPPRSCLITFDDGWLDNLQNAAPLLSNNNISACIFIPIDHVGSNEGFWQEQTASILDSIFKLPMEERQPILDEFDLPCTESCSGADRISLVFDTVQSYKSLQPADRNALILRLQRALPSTAKGSSDRFIDWEGVRRIEGFGLHIGSHACSHQILTQLEPTEADAELKRSKSVLESQLGKPVTWLAYPNGNYDSDIINGARECGYEIAFSTDVGYIRKSDNRWALKRINIEETCRTTPFFLARIAGLL